MRRSTDKTAASSSSNQRSKKLKENPGAVPTQTPVQMTMTGLQQFVAELTLAPNKLAQELVSSLRSGNGLLASIKEEAKRETSRENQQVKEVEQVVNANLVVAQPDEEENGDTDSADITMTEADPPEEYKIYKPPKFGEDDEYALEDQEEELGDVENVTFGSNYYQLGDERFHFMEYLGGEHFQKRITDLHSVEPIEVPPNMTVKPHHHQLKFAAQALFACKGPQRGILCGDEMGLGKTIETILTFWLVKHEPGFCVVVCPATLCRQWVTTIQEIWTDGNGLTTHHLVGSALTAHELLALNVDVVVVSYDQVEASFRGLRSYVDNLNAYIKEKAKNPSGKSLKKPKRPISALHSVLWRDINMPIKILALDEAQMANKSNGKRHQAIQALYFKSVIVLSGTLAHNKWDNLSGMIAYLRNHPFSSHARFMKAFSVQDYKGRTQPPDMSRMRRLQTFLQANLVARPASTITLPDCERRRAHFVLPPEHANGVAKLTFTYEQLRLYNSKELSTSESSEDAAGVIAKAMEAMMLSLHPLLHREFKKKKRHDRVNGEFEDAMTSYIDADNTTQAGLNRDNWLERVRNRALLGKESARIQCFVKVYRRVRQERPEEKVVIFSPFLKHLDIVHEVLRREFNVTALRYDGTVPLTKRTTVENAFKNCHPEIPLLLTSGAGGVGLNLTCASVMIQMEVWWNGNVEKQALFRLWRQRQQKPVLWVQLFATNSAIDCSVLGTQVKKTSLNSELMEPLIRKADEDPIKLDMFPRYNLGTLTFPEYDNLAEDT